VAKLQLKKNDRQARKTSPRRALNILLLALSVLVIGSICFWFFYRNSTLIQRDQDQLQRKLSALRSSINLPGQVVYDSQQDEGCQNNGSGLGVSYNCNYIGYKLYRNSKDLASDQQVARSWAQSNGFKLFMPDNYHDGSAIGKLDETSLQVVTYTPSLSGNDERVSRLIKSGKVAPPASGEYIYGFTINAFYFSCRSESFFKQPCPNPPSAVKNP
jgi:hypothetical protein